MTKNDEEAWDMFEKLSENSKHHTSSRFLRSSTPQTTPKKGGMYEVSNLAVCQKIDEITHRLDQITTAGTLVAQNQNQTLSPMMPQEACMICSSTEHLPTGCPSAFQFPDLVEDYVNAAQSFTQPRNNPFSNNYNLGWKDHLNFGWRQQNPGQMMSAPRPNFQSYAPTSQPIFQPTTPVQNNSSLEAKMDQLLNVV